MSDKKKNQPDSTSVAYDLMLPRWRKMECVLGGTETMREAGEEFLMRFPYESDRNYMIRLQFATLFNMTELTLESWVGRPFSDPVNISENMDEQLKYILENDVDLQGNSVNVFSRNWFRIGLAKSFAHVLIEFPRIVAKEDGQPRTLEDDRREKLRPFFRLLPPESVLFASCNSVNGKEVLSEVRILEERVGRDGFLETYTPRIRRLLPGRVELYEEQQMKGSKKKLWVVVDEYQTGRDIIPMVTFYSNRQSFMIGKSPLQDLADLNISHWNSDSEQRNVLSVARFPMLAASGAVDVAKIEIGPKKLLQSEDPNSKFYYVEHGGTAIESGFKDLAELESKMSQYGSQFLRKRPGGETATARALDSAEATSPLQDVTLRFTDALNLAIEFMGDWMGIDSSKDNTVSISTEFGPENFESGDIQILSKARETREISRSAFLDELKRRGVLSDKFNAEEDAEELMEEQAEFAASMESVIKTGQGLEDGTDEEQDGTEEDQS